MITKGSAFEEHLARRTVAAQQFRAADAKNILHMAARARSRVISEVQAGQLVYYFRRGEKKADQGYKGPAKVIAVEKGKVALQWLHGSAMQEHSFVRPLSTSEWRPHLRPGRSMFLQMQAC